MDSSILAALKGRINDQIFKLTPNQILFYAKIDVDHHISKKNNRPIFGRGGKSFLGKSQKLRDAENSMVLQLRSQGNKYRIIEPIRSDLWCVFLFYFKNYNLRKKERRNKKLNDLSNLFELPADCLQEAKIIEDDGQIQSFDLSRRLPADHNYLELFLISYNNSL
jgi:Holliday junction resolvase RusA-like endonuclease